jgi:DNA-binding CsgD family transcriptional regulator
MSIDAPSVRLAGKMGRPRRRADVAELTTREQEILALLREGLTNPQIAERLAISLETAKHQVSEILSKLGVESREAALPGSRSGGDGLARGGLWCSPAQLFSRSRLRASPCWFGAYNAAARGRWHSDGDLGPCYRDRNGRAVLSTNVCAIHRQ